ncbi:MAG: hypothetical protein RQ966_07245 [Acetobacteraceae bacterium]|nr:hypothetical protein [Acetobacteraceae bacterium]
MKVALHEIAHARAGDKGNRLNVSVIAYHADLWPMVRDQVTEARVHDLFRHRGATQVKRYELPTLIALNFVIDDALEGGVNASLNLDIHGKSNSFRVLGLEVEVPDAMAGRLAVYRRDPSD